MFRQMLAVSVTFISFALGFAASAEASYFRANLPSRGANLEQGTHIIIAGLGEEVGDSWLRAAHTQALLFKDRANHGPITIIAKIENDKYASMLKTWGYLNVQPFAQPFTGDELVHQLGSFAKIASIDFIGHNGAFLGFALEDYKNRFFTGHAKKLAALKDRFTSDAVIRILGCNTGWKLAPVMADALGIPVAGTFTFADIQRPHENGEWFYHDKGRFPEGKFKKVNEISYSQNITCANDGGCLRLKTVRINYQGKHGTYAGTLPFMKYFCGPMEKTECFRRMAKSTQYLVSDQVLENKPSRLKFAEVVAEQVCPSTVKEEPRRTCRARVVAHMMDKTLLPRTFAANDGAQLACTFRKCEFVELCNDGKCVFKASNTQTATTLTDELDAYKAGYTAWISGR